MGLPGGRQPKLETGQIGRAWGRLVGQGLGVESDLFSGLWSVDWVGGLGQLVGVGWSLGHCLIKGEAIRCAGGRASPPLFSSKQGKSRGQGNA